MTHRALLSVSDKSGIVAFARELSALGWEVIATGGTEKLLRAEGVAVTAVESITRFPECFGGRVKTLHPLITGGVLYRREEAEDVRQAEELGVPAIDLVVVNLYPFRETAKKPNATREQMVEQIDIGGPTLLRSAAKNHRSVTVVCDPADYPLVLAQLRTNGSTTMDARQALAHKVFLHTAAYDACIAETLSGGQYAGTLLTGGQQLRYGENPHQWGKYYRVFNGESEAIGTDAQRSWGTLHQGKALSYLNILDADGAWSTVLDFAEPTAVMVKHANPSGIASHSDINEAFQRAYDADRLSAFGVIIGLNRPCTAVIAQKIIDQKIFVEVVVAPGYEPEALTILAQKPNIRVITQTDPGDRCHQVLLRSVQDGMLMQNTDAKSIMEAELTFATTKRPTPEQLRDLLFAWRAVKAAKSNAIVLAKDATTVGIGCGQTSRVDSTWIAVKRAGERAKGSVMASDAFFPFPDSVEEAARQGISAIIQPGGSIRDQEVFAKAEELGIAMVLTGVRAFRH